MKSALEWIAAACIIGVAVLAVIATDIHTGRAFSCEVRHV